MSAPALAGARRRGEPGQPARSTGRGREAALWLALAVALSPTLAELAAHLAREPWSRYAVVPALLLVQGVRRDAAGVRAPRLGALLLAAAVLIELASLAAGPERLGRLALPCAALGLAWTLGRPGPRMALLAAWMVPLPYALLRAAAPVLEAPMLAAAAALLTAFGLGVEAADGALRAGASAVKIGPPELGLPLAAMLAAIGWYDALRAGRATRAALGRAFAFGAAALPAQVAALALAGAAAAVGAPAFGRAWLVHGVWPLVALLALAAGWRRAFRSAAQEDACATS